MHVTTSRFRFVALTTLLLAGCGSSRPPSDRPCSSAEDCEVVPTASARVFRAFLNVVGDGITVLDTREVFFLVPPSAGPV